MMLFYRTTTTVFPNSAMSVCLNSIFTGFNVTHWKVGLATKHLLLPGLITSVIGFTAPASIAWTLTKAMGWEDATRTQAFRLAYPSALGALLATLIVEESLMMFRGWTISIRDQLYLTGSQLHNMADDTTESQASAVTPAVTATTITTAAASAVDDITDAQESTETAGERDIVTEMAEKAESEPLLARSSRWSWRGEEGEELDSPYDSSDAGEFVKMPRNVGKAPSRSNFFQEGPALNHHHISHTTLEDEVSGTSSSVRNSNGSFADDDQIAGRTRFRRSQRLQASRGSQEDYRLE